jgi:hypothetical protein
MLLATNRSIRDNSNCKQQWISHFCSLQQVSADTSLLLFCTLCLWSALTPVCCCSARSVSGQRWHQSAAVLHSAHLALTAALADWLFCMLRLWSALTPVCRCSAFSPLSTDCSTCWLSVLHALSLVRAVHQETTECFFHAFNVLNGSQQ